MKMVGTILTNLSRIIRTNNNCVIPLSFRIPSTKQHKLSKILIQGLTLSIIVFLTLLFLRVLSGYNTNSNGILSQVAKIALRKRRRRKSLTVTALRGP